MGFQRGPALYWEHWGATFHGQRWCPTIDWCRRCPAFNRRNWNSAFDRECWDAAFDRRGFSGCEADYFPQRVTAQSLCKPSVGRFGRECV